jgi:ParB-like chromosome segregation protein Spo0J
VTVELEPRTTAPAHATGAVAFVPLAAVADDPTFRLRDEGDVTTLATSIGRLGQLVPVELRPLPGTGGPSGLTGPRYQVVAGFRRVAAVKLLQRDRVLARVFARLDDEDAWAVALAHALLTEPLLGSELEALRHGLAALPAAAWAAELLDAAIARAPVDPGQREKFLEWLAEARARPASLPARGSPPGGAEEADEPGAAGGDGDEVEVTAEELAEDLAGRLWEANQDLALVTDVWHELPRGHRRELLEQLRWVAQLVRHLEGER